MSREKTVPERIRGEKKKKCIKLARTESPAGRDGRQRGYAVYQTSLRLERIQTLFSARSIGPRVQGANGNQVPESPQRTMLRLSFSGLLNKYSLVKSSQPI